MYLTAKKKERDFGHACLCEHDAEATVCPKAPVAATSFQRFHFQQQSPANNPQHQY
jgi:hypothetical protein